MDEAEVKAENARLRAQLQELRQDRQQELEHWETQVAEERNAVREHVEALKQTTEELDSMKKNVVKLTKDLDQEVTHREKTEAETQKMDRLIQDHNTAKQEGGVAPVLPRKRNQAQEEELLNRERGSQVSTKLMKIVDEWMRHRDMRQAMLRNSCINDQVFSTLMPALSDSVSLQTLDLSNNLLSMDSCSYLCQLITTAPELSFMSLADNQFSLRSIGCFMTAIMERQANKKMIPLDLLDLQGNEGLAAAIAASPPDKLLRLVNRGLAREQCMLPAGGAELVAQVMQALWRFLFDTGHPQAKSETISFTSMDAVTLRFMENALLKVLLMAGGTGEDTSRAVTGNLVLLGQLSGPIPEEAAETGSQLGSTMQQTGALGASAEMRKSMALGQSPGAQLQASLSSPGLPTASSPSSGTVQKGGRQKRTSPGLDLRDPFADLKLPKETPKPKLQTFNLKQIVNKSGVVLMNMLERLLETTDIDAVDVETEQTLLEFACNTGNLGLAKLCYRRGAKLCGLTKRGDTNFNIVTRNKRYDIMEFLHKYGVKINSGDKDGRTALHVAAENNDVDGLCRLVEWGADVNTKDKVLMTPIHCACAKGNTKAALLLLETGADMNQKDARLYTAAAHANMNSHFALFDRLSALGGQRHGQISTKKSTKTLGEITVSAKMLKSTSLGRIGKVAVAGLPGGIIPTFPGKMSS